MTEVEIFDRVDRLEKRTRRLERADKASAGPPLQGGSASGQVPVWNSATAQWEASAISAGQWLAHAFTPAGAIGARKVWFAAFAQVLDGSFRATIPHTLGAIPAAISVTLQTASQTFVGVDTAATSATNIVLVFTAAGTGRGYVFAAV